MSFHRNPAWYHCAGALLAVVFAFGALAGCDSAEKYQKKPAVEVQDAPEPIGGEFALTGTPAQMAWVKNMTEALDAARLKWDLRDSTGAIVAADSLARVAENALDTLPINVPMSEFLTIYISDVYGTLQRWEAARGDHAAVSDISKRYNALGARLQARRDSAATQQEP